MPRDMMENERGSAINPGEAVEEKVSLSDRFGLWLGFHHCSQDDYLAMVHGYARHFRLDAPAGELEAEALEWATTRGARSGPHGLAVHPGSRRAARQAARDRRPIDAARRRGQLTSEARRTADPGEAGVIGLAENEPAGEHANERGDEGEGGELRRRG